MGPILSCICRPIVFFLDGFLVHLTNRLRITISNALSTLCPSLLVTSNRSRVLGGYEEFRGNRQHSSFNLKKRSCIIVFGLTILVCQFLFSIISLRFDVNHIIPNGAHCLMILVVYCRPVLGP